MGIFEKNKGLFTIVGNTLNRQYLRIKMDFNLTGNFYNKLETPQHRCYGLANVELPSKFKIYDMGDAVGFGFDLNDMKIAEISLRASNSYDVSKLPLSKVKPSFSERYNKISKLDGALLFVIVDMRLGALKCLENTRSGVGYSNRKGINFLNAEILLNYINLSICGTAENALVLDTEVDNYVFKYSWY